MLAVLLLHLQCLLYKMHNNGDLTLLFTIQIRLFLINGVYFPKLLSTNDLFVFFQGSSNAANAGDNMLSIALYGGTFDTSVVSCLCSAAHTVHTQPSARKI